MEDFALMAYGLKLLYAVTAVLLVAVLLRWYDRQSGRPFAEAMVRIRDDAAASALYYGLRIVAVCLLVGLLIGCAEANGASDAGEPAETAEIAGPIGPAGDRFADGYDREIRQAVERYWPGWPFPASWKAQLYQESRLDPAAVSPVGAAGLAQFMPGTWDQVRRELRIGAGISPHHDIAIEAGAYYMAKLRGQWTAQRPPPDRHKLAQASYNAGLGHLLAAQKRCGGAARYAEIVACLPAITGRHAAETLTYVRRIARWRAMLEAGA